ncbi:hypothetical protein JKF63_03864 [Porcisia hertigi]|uniref:SPRY domain-containing protein n=1 Tax=Porcisia hertigi TaxID=2761500 RepID=A0A836L455_9TRYP|nr:hypothetical protein JKF63_03864 [Porcisia hertigi]
MDLRQEVPAPARLGAVPLSANDTNVAPSSAASKTADRTALPPLPRRWEEENSPQQRPELSVETRQRVCSSSSSSTSAPATATVKEVPQAKISSTPTTPRIPKDKLDETRVRGASVVSPQRHVNGAGAASSGIKNGNESGTSMSTSSFAHKINEKASESAPAKPNSRESVLPMNGDKPAYATDKPPTNPNVTPRMHLSDGDDAALSPRQRHTAPPPSTPESPLALGSTCAPSINDGEMTNAGPSTEKQGSAYRTAQPRKNEEETSRTPQTATASFGTNPGTPSHPAAASQARLGVASCPSTPRSLAHSAAFFASNEGPAVSKSTEATLAAEVRELGRALKEKEREIARLTRSVDKANESSAKAQEKAGELQGKLNSEKSLFSAHKKSALAEKQELQKELRQAQSALRSAEQAQDKLQRELDKQREKLAAASSRSSSTTTAPYLTSVSAGTSSVLAEAKLQAKVLSLENETKSMRNTIQQLEEQLAAATPIAGPAQSAEDRQDTAAARGSAETIETLRNEVVSLRRLLSSHDATCRGYQEKIDNLVKENEALKARGNAWRNPARDDGTSSTPRSTSASGVAESEGRSPSTRSLCQAGTAEVPVKRDTAHEREEMRVIQAQLGSYRRMNARAERSIKQLEEELTACRHRAEVAEEQAAKMTSCSADSSASVAVATNALRDVIDSLKLQLSAVTGECDDLRQCLQERSEEATTLHLALQEAEEERDALMQQTLDLQSRVAEAEKNAVTALAVSKAEFGAALEKSHADLLAVKSELQAAADAAQRHQDAADSLGSELVEEQERSARLEEERQAAQAEAAGQMAAAEESKRQVDRLKVQCRGLRLKLADATAELAVLQQKCAHISQECDGALSQSSTKRNTTAESDKKMFPHQPTSAGRHTTTEDNNRVNHPVFSSEAKQGDGVSRNLSDALLSANRRTPAKGTNSTPPPTVEQKHEPQAGDRHKLDALSRYSEVPAIIDPFLRDSQQRLQLPLELLGRFGDSCSPGRGRSPGRARSPGAAHVLNNRYFDPTMFSGREGQPCSVGDDPICISAHIPSPSSHHVDTQKQGDAQSPSRAVCPRSTALSTSAMELQTLCSGSAASLASMFSDIPQASLFYSSCDTVSLDKGAGQRTAVELQFSNTAGRLLLSKRRQRVQRPVFPAVTRGADFVDVCCAALGSISHRIHFSMMSNAGRHHLKNSFRFTIRVLSDCGNGDGDILVGFADRYVPMESFGDKQNALHYNGCYYLSLREGRIFCPAQNIRGAAYAGWSAAAAEAVERRRSSGAGPGSVDGALVTWAQDGETSFTEVRGASSPMATHVPSRPPEYVVRAGDEIACTLYADGRRSIHYSWNGVECGVAFTGVTLSPSLYPCIEVNAPGGTVELL